MGLNFICFLATTSVLQPTASFQIILTIFLVVPSVNSAFELLLTIPLGQNAICCPPLASWGYYDKLFKFQLNHFSELLPGLPKSI